MPPNLGIQNPTAIFCRMGTALQYLQYQFWILGRTKGALSAQAGFWIQSLWLKAVSAMSNNTTDKKGTQTLVVGINIINQLT